MDLGQHHMAVGEEDTFESSLARDKPSIVKAAEGRLPPPTEILSSCLIRSFELVLTLFTSVYDPRAPCTKCIEWPNQQ